MFAQLVGLPGAGKSTIAARLERLYPDRFTCVVVELETIPELLKNRPIKTLFTFFRLTPFFLYAILGVHSPLGWRARLVPVLVLLKVLLAFKRLRREGADSEKIQFLDDFVYQLAISLFGYSTRLPSRVILRIFLTVLRNDFVLPIFIDTDGDQARQRAASRPHGLPERMAGLNHDILKKVYANQAALLEQLKALSPRAIRVDNRQDAAQCTDRICDEVQPYLSGNCPKPTVAHFVFNLTGYSGAARQALSLARHIDGFDAVVFNLHRKHPTRSAIDAADRGIRVVHLSRGRPIKSAVVIAYFTWRYRIQIFHLHGMVVVGLLAGLLLRRRLILKTTLLGTDDLDSFRGRVIDRILLKLVERVDINVAISTAIAQINRRYLPPEKVITLPNGVSTRVSAHAKQDPIFCTVGLVCRRKRTHLVIERFLAYYAQIDDAKLYVIGPYGDNDDLEEADEGYAQYCVSLIPPVHRSKVVFTGLLPRDEVERLYQASLAFVCLSEYEGMPNALLEAMAANCVPITSEIGGVAREIIPDQRCGYVLGNGDRFPTIDELREISCGLASRRRVDACYGLDMIAKRYSRIYSNLLSSGASFPRKDQSHE